MAIRVKIKTRIITNYSLIHINYLCSPTYNSILYKNLFLVYLSSFVIVISQ